VWLTQSKAVCSDVLKGLGFKPVIKIYKIAGEHQPADIFTQGLPRVGLKHHCRIIMGKRA